MNHILYRLPDDNMAHDVSCRQAVVLSALSEIGRRAGYVFAPFDIKGKHPILLFPPETEDTWSVADVHADLHIAYTDNADESFAAYRKAFDECMQRLQQGHVHKIVLSRTLRLQLSAALSPSALRELFVTACQQYPHSFVALVQPSRGSVWLIATPEVLLESVSEGLHTMALAATMSIEEARGLKPEEWSDKDREEQHIVSEYIRHRLQSIGIQPSVSALQTLTAGQIVHLCTHFTLPLPLHIGPLVQALHPTPAVCGHPSEQAASILATEEHHDRAYYAGFSGPVGLDCGTHLYVTLRCMEMWGTSACLYAGGGLLPASICAKEWTETLRKLKTMLHVLQ